MIIDTDNFSWAINQIKKHDLVFVDLETTGLEPFNGDKICGVAVMDLYHSNAVPPRLHRPPYAR